ncbi:MAG TPA: relaxase/mobilization nuclease domain-containing protein [Puia sp.]|jgi:hypothetical protein
MAVVLDVEGVRRYNQELMAADFEEQHHLLMPEKEKPVFHAALTFPPGEEVSDEKLVEIGRKYMQKIDVVNTQYAFVKHLDKGHLHMHIIANRVNYDGKPTGKGLVIERSIKAAEELTREYELRQDRGKRLSATRLDALHEPDVKRYRIYQAIQELLPRCRGMDDLEKNLLRKGITMRYRRNKETGERQGISFRLENRSFKGSRVDRTYSLRGLEKRLVLQQTMLLREKEQQEMMLRLKQSMKPEVPQKKEALPGNVPLPLQQEQELRLKQEDELEEGQRLRRGQRPHF